MFNPLVDNFNDLSDNDIELKIAELSRKYFISHNPQVQQQIAVMLDMFKQELTVRRAIQKQKQQEQINGNNDLDNLIKIS